MSSCSGYERRSTQKDARSPEGFGHSLLITGERSDQFDDFKGQGWNSSLEKICSSQTVKLAIDPVNAPSAGSMLAIKRAPKMTFV